MAASGLWPYVPRMSAKSTIEAFRAQDVNILVQEFIREAGGSDLRAFVVGQRVIAAMQRTGAAGEWPNYRAA